MYTHPSPHHPQITRWACLYHCSDALLCSLVMGKTTNNSVFGCRHCGEMQLSATNVFTRQSTANGALQKSDDYGYFLNALVSENPEGLKQKQLERPLVQLDAINKRIVNENEVAVEIRWNIKRKHGLQPTSSSSGQTALGLTMGLICNKNRIW